MVEFDQAAVAANIECARRQPILGTLTDWWITLSIAGTEDALAIVADALGVMGGENLGDKQTGFLNAKLPVPNDPSRIISVIRAVGDLTRTAGAELVGVDVDSSPDVRQSAFAVLWARQRP